MINHTYLLNYLIKKYGLKSYLEIGVFHPSTNFNKIQCANKIGVDPAQKALATYCMTSDEYFQQKSIRTSFEMIFIDGLHEEDQVKKDFENSLRCLLPHGFIMLHDTNPMEERYTSVPRNTKVWHGDVYKFASSLRNYPDINFITIDIDHGCTIVWKQENQARDVTIDHPIDWEYFNTNREFLLRLKPLAELQICLPDAESHSKKYRPV